MDLEGTVEGHFEEAVDETPGIMKEVTSKWGSDAAQPAPGGCFDCNICLDFAVEPVVTLCGHLYCWPCIYKWLQLESTAPQQCPVCKANLSQTTLVPLYGRGHSNKDSHHSFEIPQRPRPKPLHSNYPIPASPEPPLAPRRLHHHHHAPRLFNNRYMSSSSSSVTLLGGSAIAILPWVFGNHEDSLYHSNQYFLMGSGGCPRLRRQEMQARRSLERISFFLFCCVVLFLLIF